MYLASASSVATDLLPLHRVRLEPARSAEPPTSSGSSGAKASIAICEALREATFGPSACSLAMYLSAAARSEEHTSELQSLMRISYAVFCLKKKKKKKTLQKQHRKHK